MPSGNFHYYLDTKLNADVTSGTRKLHCYVVKFRFTSLYGNRQLDLDLRLTGSRVPGYINLTEHKTWQNNMRLFATYTGAIIQSIHCRL